MGLNPDPLYSKPITDFISPTEFVLESGQKRLQEGYTDPAEPTKRIPGLDTTLVIISDLLDNAAIVNSVTKAPETYIVYRGSTYANNPRRTYSVSILNVVKVETSKSGTSALGRKMLDNTLRLLDNFIVGCTHWRITNGSDEPIQPEGTNYLIYQVNFTIEDN